MPKYVNAQAMGDVGSAHFLIEKGYGKSKHVLNFFISGTTIEYCYDSRFRRWGKDDLISVLGKPESIDVRYEEYLVSKTGGKGYRRVVDKTRTKSIRRWEITVELLQRVMQNNSDLANSLFPVLASRLSLIDVLEG